MKNRIAIGTRGSKLALWQAEWTRDALTKQYPDLQIDLIKIKTTGDKITDVPLAQVGGKGLFVKEIEEALLRREIDLAVHSMKDVPTEFPPGLHLAVICRREDPRDAFVSRLNGKTFAFQTFRDLPNNAKVGTSSLRRACQLLHVQPDLKIEQLRGNLDTRLRKLDEGQYDAIILACAGLERLGLEGLITEVLEPPLWLPAATQGTIGIQCRSGDEEVMQLIEPLRDPDAMLRTRAERLVAAALQGSCQVPLAVFAIREGDLLRISSLIGMPDGSQVLKAQATGSPDDVKRCLRPLPRTC
jgi:hydroxymethylbilane synthase